MGETLAGDRPAATTHEAWVVGEAWVSSFLTAAHVVSKRLLMACKLTSKLGMPSEPCAELIPSAFREVGHTGYMGDLPF